MKEPSGNKTIGVTIYFYTDVKGEKLKPKHALDKGAVYLKANVKHGISGYHHKPFNTMSELVAAVEKVLVSGGVTLHHGRRNKLYA